jgi:hypothetical protein
MGFSGTSYTVGEQQFPRVTRILGVLDKPFLGPWQRKMVAESVYTQFHNESDNGTVLTDMKGVRHICNQAKQAADLYRDEAADRGKRIHDFLEAIFDAKEHLAKHIMETDDEGVLMSKIQENAAKWVMDEDVKAVEVEKMVVSKKHGYAGTCDLIVTMKNHKGGPPVLAVVDWKTGGGVYDTHKLQMAAYAKAYEEMTGSAVDIAFVMHITPALGKLSPKLHLHQWDINNEFETFLKVMDVYKWRNGNR